MSALEFGPRVHQAAQMLVYLARQELGRVVTAAELARELGISPKVLEDITGALKTAHLIQSRRGREGGFCLAAPAANLTLLDAVNAIDGHVSPPSEGSTNASARTVAAALSQAQAQATRTLAGITIAHLAEEADANATEGSMALMYHL